jgi:nucleotide-binding universal stress UspA family protein
MRTTNKNLAKAARRKRLTRQNLTIRRILVPLDFSGYARQALACAVPLARRHRAKINLVHVTQSPVMMRTFPDGSLTVPIDTTRMISVAKSHLDELAAQLLPTELRGQTMVREGNPGYEVVAAAESLKADLIVLSATGRSGLKRILLGSTAERIVRHAHCPVLTVRRQLDGTAKRLLALQQPLYPEQLPWRRILAPVDFSFTSLRALQEVVALALENGARLYLLNVVEPNPYPAGMEGAVLVMSDAEVARDAKKTLTRIIRRLVPPSVRATPLVCRGRAASVIVDLAREKKVDLITLATHGHTGLDRLLLGSTAEQVVRHAQCPVLVVRKSRAGRVQQPTTFENRKPSKRKD